MPRGGVRPGSGRKKGSATKITREIANKVINSGQTPLEVIIDAMRVAAGQKDWPNAVDYASKAAPYIHPRLQAVELTGEDGESLNNLPPVLKVEFVKPDDLDNPSEN
jgi:hypothetical protein